MPPAGRLGDKAHADMDAHGCPACPHSPIGPAILGSPDVVINGQPALRVGDPGIHAPCCGPNMWTAQKGAEKVLINGKSAYRKDDPSQHCGGSGKLIEGSPNVLVGDSPPGGSAAPGSVEWHAQSSSPAAQSSPPGKAPSAGAQAAESALKLTWLEVRLVDEAGEPVPNAQFEVVLPDGSKQQGTLDSAGHARLEGIPIGMCSVSFPELDGKAWRRG